MKEIRTALFISFLYTGVSGCGGNGMPTSPTDPTQPAPPVDGRFVAETLVTLPNFHVSMVFTSENRILLTQKGGFGGNY